MKTMIRKITFFLILLLLLCSAASAAPEIKIINTLNYHKSMFDALKPETFLKIPFGSIPDCVGGGDQDPDGYTEGVPFAFRPTVDGNVWILDSANKSLKLFSKEGSLFKNISLEKFGKIIRDFAFDKNDGFWLLNNVDGYIYRIDASGSLVSKIEGFNAAEAIEAGVQGGLLVDMPMMAAVLRFGDNELLKSEYPYGEGLTLIENAGGGLLALEMLDKKVNLLLRNVASPAENIPLAEFPLDIEDPLVTYAGAKILGRDLLGNLYLNLIASHEEGTIYRDRIFRCTTAGKILAQTDILTIPCMAPTLPRERVVTDDGKVMTFYLKGNDYILALYSF